MSHEVEDLYSLSPLQQGIIFHRLLESEPATCLSQLHVTLDGPMHLPAFRKAWKAVLQRHSALRTSFNWKDAEEPVQIVHRRVPDTLQAVDWSGLGPEEQQERLDEFLQSDRQKEMDLEVAPVLRMTLICCSDEQTELVLSHQHLTIDGWSLGIILGELLVIYQANLRSEILDLPAPRPFRDYIAWLGGQDVERARQFWRQELEGLDEPTPLRLDTFPPEPTNERSERYRFAELSLTGDQSAAVRQFAQDYRLTQSTLMHSAWAWVLLQYTGAADVVFGTTLAGRPPELERVQSMVGLFVNTLPLRVRSKTDVSIVDWLSGLQEQLTELQQFVYSSIVDIQGLSDVPRGQPLFESIFVFQNYGMSSEQETGGDLHVSRVRVHEHSDYPLAIVASPKNELSFRAIYDIRRFRHEAICQLLQHLKTTLLNLLVDPEKPMASVSILNAAERRQIQFEWNRVATPHLQPLLVHQAFAKQAAAQPDAIALEVSGELFTYGQIDADSNRLAIYLKSFDVRGETVVAVVMDSSHQMIISLLAILKAGAAYLPIDCDSPSERIRFLLEDSNAAVLLTQQKHLEDLPPKASHQICVDSQWDEIRNYSNLNPTCPADPANLAYVIYTSSSTGKPKGVEIQHGSLSNLVEWHVQAYNVSPFDHATQVASPAFDASVWEIWPYLSSGSTLHILENRAQNAPIQILRWMSERQVTIGFLPTPMAEAVLDEPWSQTFPLRTLLTGGDKLGATREIDFRLVNHYGPTENTVVATCADVSSGGAQPPPIGRPIENVDTYVLHHQMELLPEGIPGELHIGGEGLARAYRHRPDLTSASFIPHPYAHQPGKRIYKSGDLCVCRAEGNLQFLGRQDHQVKVRGFRIELGEIENALLEHPSVDRAVVMVRRDLPGDERLTAYVVAPSVEVDLTVDLTQHLEARIPSYMVPLSFVVLDEIPVTSRGKIDRRNLPAPTALAKTDSSATALTPVASIMAAIWARVFRVPSIDVRSDFFELGGHSLLATQLISRVEQAFDVTIPLHRLFESPTVAGLTRIVEAEQASSDDGPDLVPVPRTSQDVLSFAQERFWFLEQWDPGKPVYNSTMAVQLHGSLDVSALESSLDQIIERHESLRTVFRASAGVPYQVVQSGIRWSLQFVDLTRIPEAARLPFAHEMMRKLGHEVFDLQNGPLFRATLFRLDRQDHALLLRVSHMVFDGWSSGILFEELAANYDAAVQERGSPLPPLSIQYADFAQWQRDRFQREQANDLLTFWKQQLENSPRICELPPDRPRPAMQTFHGATRTFDLSPELSARIREISDQEASTPFITLLTGFSVVLQFCTGLDRVVVGTDVANRNRLATENVIGPFLNQLVLPIDLSENPTFRDLLQQVRRTTLGAFAHLELPFDRLVKLLEPDRDPGRNPLFQVMFSFMNIPAKDVVLSGLLASKIRVDVEATSFDLSVYMVETDDHLSTVIRYNTDLYNASTIDALFQRFELVLSSVIVRPDRTVRTLRAILEKNEQQMRDEAALRLEESSLQKLRSTHRKEVL